MTDDKPRASPPKEGSNRGDGPKDQKRANVTDTMSGRHPKHGSEHTDDGLPVDQSPDENSSDRMGEDDKEEPHS
jgi:hypothetical protein